MSLCLMKKEILEEMEAVKHFIELAIEAQTVGHTEAAQFFLAEAQEDCKHAFLYARELDKFHTNSKKDRSIVDITRSYYEMEYETVDRISLLYKEAKEKNLRSTYPFITEMMSKHSENCYKAKKMLQKIETLYHTESVYDIEEVFFEEHEDLNTLV